MDKSGGGDSRDGGPPSSTSQSPQKQPTAIPVIGCGSSSGAGPSGSSSTATMTLNVTTTTGGSFSVLVDGENSVENLKKIISKKLKVSKDRICLLHRERELHDGTLRENGLMDGSKLILTPNVETGLLAQRAENTVMQALESLNDNQVNDFLSGKSPLNLSVRLGDHMMLIQLQLSTLNPSSQNGSRSKAHKSRSLTGSSSSGAGTSLMQATSSRSRTSIPIGFRRVATDGSSGSNNRTIIEHVTETQTFTKQELENIHSIVKNLAESENATMAIVRPSAPEPMETEPEVRNPASESPIKSLSNLVSSSINSSNIPVPSNNNSLPLDLPSACTDPISANLTSCLCKRLDNNDNNSCDTTCSTRPLEALQPSTSTASLHRTSHNPIARHKSKVHTFRKHYSFDGATLEKTELETGQPVASTSAPNSPQLPEQALVHHSHHHHHSHQHYHHHHHQLNHQSQPQPGPSNASRALSTDPATVENPALAEASRNLTQTLRKLSKRVFTKTSDAAQEQARNVSSGAVIESMKHHGKGIYSGTFSGTLNPALQDKFGRPKRDISTIIHILNDLLSAAPQCARNGTKIYFEPSTSSAGTSSTNQVTAGANSTPGPTTTSNGNGSNLQAAALMAPTTLTTPMAAASPRLVSRCVPASIHTKKYPSNSGTTTTVASLGPTSSCCSGCKPVESQTNGGVSTLAARCHHHAPKAAPKVLCKCGLPLATTPTASFSLPPISGTPQHCQSCAAAISAAELENSKTKSKLDNLRLIMQQKKERREARKQKCAPYSTGAPVMASPLASSSTAAAPSSPPPMAIEVSGTTSAVAVSRHSTLPVVAEAQPIDETMADGADTALAAVAASESINEGNSKNKSSNAANSATATATATTTTTAAAATSPDAAQNHQIVEEVDTVA